MARVVFHFGIDVHESGSQPGLDAILKQGNTRHLWLLNEKGPLQIEAKGHLNANTMA